METKDRKPVDIHHIQYAYLFFTKDGYIDIIEKEKQAALAGNMVPPIEEEQGGKHIIDAQHRFIRKSYADRYLWKPTPEIEASILEAVFGYL